ncbi:MAG TPA: FG-GAP-like repeat-containing protein [Tepidisphaeraceae bacterium]|jgi:hypothetical protein|nr:FG-GAP-like repeat-containing protein [Tepidisphaeraceae bacterium]
MGRNTKKRERNGLTRMTPRGNSPARPGRRTARSVVPYNAEPLERRVLLSATFQSAINSNILAADPSVTTVVGDLNGDGIPDLIAGRADGTSAVLLGTSTGGFVAGPILQTHGDLFALADFTGDGRLDLATSAGLMVGQGDGSFAAPFATQALPANTVSLFTGDFNGDGRIDLAAVTFTPGTALNHLHDIGVAVFLNGGNGFFQPPLFTVSGSLGGVQSFYAQFLTGDFNGDGTLDIVSPLGVQLGTGHGTFQAPMPLPVTAFANTPGLAVGDFNGDGKLDVAGLLPSPSGNQIALLTGVGIGTFNAPHPFAFGDAGLLTTLAAIDINNDGFPDLVAGTAASGAQAQRLGVALNNGDGTFATPAFFNIGAEPIAFFAGDVNADGRVDLLSVNTSVNPNIAMPDTGTLTGMSTSVLLNTVPARLAAKAVVASVADPVTFGDFSQFSVTLSGPAGTATPTGTVTFFDGATQLGKATLAAGKASLNAGELALGVHLITAVYSGDSNFGVATSAPFKQTVLTITAHSPLLSAGVGLVTLASPFIAGDKGTATVTVINAGGAAADGVVDINLFLSQTGAIDSTAFQLNVPALRGRHVHIKSGGVATFLAHFTAGTYPAGGYVLVAQLAAGAGFTVDQVSPAPAAGKTTFQNAGRVFGTLGKRHVNFVLSESNRTTSTLSLTGPGLATVSDPSFSPVTVTVTGTTAASHLKITAGKKTGPATIDAITVAGPIGAFDATGAFIDSSLSFQGNAGLLTLGDVGAGGGATTSLTLAGKARTSIIGKVFQGVVLNVAGPISSIKSGTWTGQNTIIAPSIDSLNVKGDFAGTLLLQGALHSAAITGSITGGAWAIPKGIGSLTVGANFSNTRIFAGTNAGPDNQLGTIDDKFAAATISAVKIKGAVFSSEIAAGLSPTPGNTITGTVLLLPHGKIASLSAGGMATSDSRFLAAVLPATATLAGQSVQTSTDPHFQNT